MLYEMHQATTKVNRFRVHRLSFRLSGDHKIVTCVSDTRKRIIPKEREGDYLDSFQGIFTHIKSAISMQWINFKMPFLFMPYCFIGFNFIDRNCC